MKRLIKDWLNKGLGPILRRYLQDERYDRMFANELAPWLKRMAAKPEYLPLWQEKGFNLIPHDCFQPIPDLNDLHDAIWANPSVCHGIDFRAEFQVSLLADFAARFKDEYLFPSGPQADSRQFHLGNGAFESVDAEVLFCFVRDLAPKRMIEVGAGYSTLVSAAAMRRNLAEGNRTEFTVIDPYPRDFIISGSINEISRLIPERVESLPVDLFAELAAGDVLFIDSTHVSRIGGDVNYLYFKVLPALQKGVTIHVHDIVLPEEYLRRFVMEKHWFWNEQYLVQAFLMHNQDYEILWCGNYMRIHFTEELRNAFDTFDPSAVTPGSLWMRKKI